MATTMLLDRNGWDLCQDAAGNWALATEPYSQSQDVASAVRVFQGECYYNTDLGVPYFSDVLGRYQPTQIMRARAAQAALTVPGVVEANALLVGLGDRKLGGQVQFRTADGAGVAVV